MPTSCKWDSDILVGPTHFVVFFDDDECVACVPKKLILNPARPGVGDVCTVQWSDDVIYTAKVLTMGKLLGFVFIQLAT